jgi:Leucine carboxyl methyltransferase
VADEHAADVRDVAPDHTAVRVALRRAMHVDTFAQRRPEIAARLRVFEADRPGPQAWKRQRLTDLGYGVPGWLRLVPVDFEAAGFARARHVPSSELAERYFTGRPDRLRPATGEDLLVATT